MVFTASAASITYQSSSDRVPVGSLEETIMLNSALILPRWLRRRHDRRILMAMDDRMLADVGISRSQIDLYLSGGRKR